MNSKQKKGWRKVGELIHKCQVEELCFEDKFLTVSFHFTANQILCCFKSKITSITPSLPLTQQRMNRSDWINHRKGIGEINEGFSSLINPKAQSSIFCLIYVLVLKDSLIGI